MNGLKGTIEMKHYYQAEVWSENYFNGSLAKRYFCMKTKYYLVALVMAKLNAMICDYFGVIKKPMGIIWRVVEFNNE